MIKYDKLKYDEELPNEWEIYPKEVLMDQYIYGVQCGNKDCYACGTQRYNCNELNEKDNLENKKEKEGN